MGDILGGRCLNLTIRDDETIDELVARTGLSREAAAELIGFAERLAARRKRDDRDAGNSDFQDDGYDDPEAYSGDT